MAHIKIIEWDAEKYAFSTPNAPQKMYIKLISYATNLHGSELKKTARSLYKCECIAIDCLNVEKAETLAIWLERHGAKFEVDWIRKHL